MRNLILAIIWYFSIIIVYSIISDILADQITMRWLKMEDFW